MANVNVQVIGLDKLVAIMEKYPQVSEKHVNAAINRSLVRILGTEKKEAPVATGNLRDNWRVDVGRFEGSLRSNAPYAAAVNNGSRPHFPPVEALRFWAQKRGLNPWAVARSIAKKGTKPNPFFVRAVDAERENVNKEFKRAGDAILQEISNNK